MIYVVYDCSICRCNLQTGEKKIVENRNININNNFNNYNYNHRNNIVYEGNNYNNHIKNNRYISENNLSNNILDFFKCMFSKFIEIILMILMLPYNIIKKIIDFAKKSIKYFFNLLFTILKYILKCIYYIFMIIVNIILSIIFIILLKNLLTEFSLDNILLFVIYSGIILWLDQTFNKTKNKYY